MKKKREKKKKFEHVYSFMIFQTDKFHGGYVPFVHSIFFTLSYMSSITCVTISYPRSRNHFLSPFICSKHWHFRM